MVAKSRVTVVHVDVEVVMAPGALMVPRSVPNFFVLFGFLELIFAQF
jgi:hypothetical protein